MKKIINDNKLFLVGVLLGLIFGGVITYNAVILIASDTVIFDNNKSKLSSGENEITTQAAIDSLKAKVDSASCKPGYSKQNVTAISYDCIYVYTPEGFE